MSFVPLELCYAKTVHTFQGQNAGPVLQGQPPNAVARIIVNPGTKQFEGHHPGLSYTIVSHATTMGNDKLSSAIYFHGQNSNVERFTHLRRQANGKLYKRIYQRDRWVQTLKQGYVKKLPSQSQINKLFHWADTYTIKKQHYERLMTRGSTGPDMIHELSGTGHKSN
jgi:hypothetical protein